MARTSIRWAELHAPLFQKAEGVQGKGYNLGQKLDPHHRAGLELEYDEEQRHLYVKYSGVTTRVPETNISSMIPGAIEKAVAQVVPTLGKPIEAQVESPQGHVFAGPGKGKTK